MGCRKKEIAKNLVEELLSLQASEKREIELVEELSKILPDPEFMVYIFHSNEFEKNDGTFDVDRFLEKCFKYKPIAL